jgi:hypothetical protein
MQNGDRVAVYDHSAWHGFLLQAILPQAHRVEVSLGESSADVVARLPAGCRVFVFHINLTLSVRLPVERHKLVGQLQSRDITVRNARVTDISKPAVHRICQRAGVASARARLDGDPDEPVLVKTACNYHGLPESLLSSQQKNWLGYQSASNMPPQREAGYRIMRRADVPAIVWGSPHWVVERYITNTAHRFHRVYVAGNSLVISRVFDSSVFKKMPEGIARESYFLNLSQPRLPSVDSSDVRDVAALSARVAQTANLQYGALDIVSDDDGGYYVIDINTTPFWGDGGHPDLLAYLRAGLMERRCDA